jgi:MFS family permease
MAIFLAALDQTIVSTATPTITSDLKAFSDFSWISTAYLLTSTALQPLYGKFSDIFGRKYFSFSPTCMQTSLTYNQIRNTNCHLYLRTGLLVVWGSAEHQHVDCCQSHCGYWRCWPLFYGVHCHQWYPVYI